MNNNQLEMPRWRLFGTSDVWRTGGTGTTDWWFLGIRIYRRHFHHSTAWLD